MTLTQNGKTVKGNYEHDQGYIEGKVQGDSLVGTWDEAPTREPPHDKGNIVFTWVKGKEGKAWTGKWRYGAKDTDPWRSDSWTGEKIE